jgi:hypothetical protein
MVAPFKEHSTVKTKVDLKDMHGRIVPAGSEGHIVHINPTPPDKPPVYAVEVMKLDAQGIQRDMYIVDATHEQIELVRKT